MLAVRLRQPKHLAPAKTHHCRCFGYLDPAIRQIVQHAHPVDLRPAHRNHRHRPNAPQLKLWRVTSLSGPTVTSLSGVYSRRSHNERLWNGRRGNRPTALPASKRTVSLPNLSRVMLNGMGTTSFAKIGRASCRERV